MQQQTAPLTNLQFELLKIFSFELAESELLDIKQILIKHFSERLYKNTSKIWDENEYTQKDMDIILNEKNQ